jgi:hypothetical protein
MQEGGNMVTRSPFFTLAGLVVLSLYLAVPARAATLSYAPTHAELTIAAGASATTPLSISLVTTDFQTYYVWFVDTVTDGNLPVGWITPSSTWTFLSYSNLTDFTTLTIQVPEGTPPGTYSGALRGKGMAAHGFADAGSGVRLAVTVPSGCDQTPGFIITSLSPHILWPPNHKMKEVHVDGQVLVPTGCSLSEVGYSIDDEYHVYTGVGEITVDANGDFSATIPLEAWREGKDKDGRHYRITLFAQDEAGTGVSQTLEVIVPHDMRNDDDETPHNDHGQAPKR